MNAEDKIIEYMKNNYDETMDIVATELDLDKSAVEEMYTQYDFNPEITEEDRASFQNVADFMYDTGMIDTEFDTSSLFLD